MDPENREEQTFPSVESEDPAPYHSGKPKLRISINAPFVLGFATLGLVAMILSALTQGGSTRFFFELGGQFEFGNPSFYFKLLLHPLGHLTWAHYFGNFTIILLVGPLLEEKYGSVLLAVASVLTALVTGLSHVLMFNSALIGASGVAFMMILLTSMVNVRQNTVPLTFLIVAILFMGREIAASFQNDTISQFAHIVGGICGAAFGYWWNRK